MPLRPFPAQVDLPALERETLVRWSRTDVFARTLAQTAAGPAWIFYEGPPTANGMPGTHHVEARAFKDLFCRYRTQRGYSVPRRGGWDCHGLPVELAVEKELGFTSKHDIEAYGIAEFNAKCRESVLRHVDAFEQMSARMGYWLDYDNAYRTMDPHYIESVWWSLKTLYDKGLLAEDHRIAPYCPRCETGLSDHEVAQGYATVTDPSVYFRMPVTSGPLADLGAHLLVWTTQPWTIFVNTLVAVHPEVTYVAARTGGGDVLVVAEPLLADALGDDVEVLARYQGRELERTTYQRLFDVPGIYDGATPAHYVALADYVTVDAGTGLVGQSPAFGADDMETARAYGAPVVNPVRRDGHFEADLPVVGGLQVKVADQAVIDDLRDRSLLWHEQPFEHSYPLCWRCDTRLLYYALPSWYVRTTARKDEMLAQNAKTDWHPATIRDGRYGDWLANNVDWALSRNRYWGTPLPLWRCNDGHITAIGSLAELSAAAGRDVTGIDPHRPFIDEVEIRCSHCNTPARRVEEVIDCWYDAGSMPFAQWGAPHRNNAEFEAAFPAQYIAEALDQTRGWFYTLMAIGTLVFDQSPYESVLCLGIILAEDGRRMSKHLGNILEPIPLMERHSADALRWFMVASGSPWSARRVGHQALDEVVRKVLLTTWNTASFLALYADASGWEPSAADPPASRRPVLDRWALAELAATVTEVTVALETFDSPRAARRIAAFVDDLSNWYVRRSRRRFWAGDPAALATLHDCLRDLCRLLAPFMPFLADELWQRLVVAVEPDAPDSVHLAGWPQAGAQNPTLQSQVALTRRLVELGRGARAESGVRTRQPLARALVAAGGFAELPDDLRREVAEELNVGALEALSGDLVELTVKPNFRALGKRFGNRTQQVARQVGADGYDRATGTIRVELDGAAVELGADELIVNETPREGWAVTSGDGASVALDLALTPALVRAGLAREVSRLVNEARKKAGLAVTDRIELWWRAAGEVAAAVEEHLDTLTADVLAVAVVRGRPDADLSPYDAPDLSLTIWLREAGA
ncbi:MAG TPA: isoleucine--tRNA ligase [Mycobacteriales bacterium]|nr:isoleucine--tRNA ligase [Mycobacteriales bacterium]